METKPPPTITALTRLFGPRPFKLSALSKIAANAQDHRDFTQLVREYLPKDAEEILSMPEPTHRVQKFSTLFGQQYFPLHQTITQDYMDEWEPEWGETPYGFIIQGIPYELHGIDPTEDPHDLWANFHGGIASMALIPRLEPSDYIDSDIRTSWFESALEVIPRETLAKIPPGGIPRETLASVLPGTEYEGLHNFTLWLTSSADNFFVDEQYDPEQGLQSADPWTSEHIGWVTQEWREASVILNSMHTLANWLDDDLPTRFDRMLDFVQDQANQLASE